MNKKIVSIFSWSWFLFILFFALAIVDYRFGILGLICMVLPLFHSFRGRGKIHCSLHCPRGSFLANIMRRVSIGLPVPLLMRAHWFKMAVFVLLMGLFAFSMYQSRGDVGEIGFAIFRMVAVTTLIALLLAVLFKPRTWCTVCPMGYASSLLAKKRVKDTAA